MLRTEFQTITSRFRGGIVNFSILYLIGRYIKIHYKSKNNQSAYFLQFFTCIAIMNILEIIYSKLLGFPFTAFQNLNSIFIVMASIIFFLAFQRMNFHNKLVNKLAMHSFSVYIIHFNKAVMPLISALSLYLKTQLNTPIWLILLIIPCAIYLVSITIEHCRAILLSNIEEYICTNTTKIILKVGSINYHRI